MPRKPKPIFGVRAIARHMGMATETILQLLHHHDFPACQLPGHLKRWIITTSLIDRWILARRVQARREGKVYTSQFMLAHSRLPKE